MATDVIARALAANGGGGGEPVDAYTKAETNNLLATKANANETYTNTEVDTKLDTKLDIDMSNIDEVGENEIVKIYNEKSTSTGESSVEFIGTGKALENYQIVGRSVQNGTPSLDAPVRVSGIGDKVKNLINADDIYKDYKISNDVYKINILALSRINIPIDESLVGKTLTLSVNIAAASGLTGVVIRHKRGSEYNYSNTVSGGYKDYAKITFTYESGDVLSITYTDGTGNVVLSEMQLEIGTKRTEYVPFDKPVYRIPISYNGNNVNIDLDRPLLSNETVNYNTNTILRRVKKIVIDSAQGFELGTLNQYDIRNFIQRTVYRDAIESSDSRNGAWFCENLPIADDTSVDNVTEENLRYAGFNLYIRFKASRAYNLTQLNTYLQNNPIVVYYVVNDFYEPIDLPSIPTVSGLNTISVNTENSPKSISINTYNDYETRKESTDKDSKIFSTINAASKSSVKDSNNIKYTSTGKTIDGFQVNGNSSQKYIPSADVQVDVKGVGDRVNLFDYKAIIKKDGYLLNDASVEQTSVDSGYTLNYIEVEPNTTYSLTNLDSQNTSGYTARIYCYTHDLSWIGRIIGTMDSKKFTFKTPNNCKYIRIQYRFRYETFVNGMITKGDSTPTEQIPYDQFNISITNNNEKKLIILDKPLYNEDSLNIDHIVRKSEVLLLNGGEDWQTVGENDTLLCFSISCEKTIQADTIAYCNRFVWNNTAIDESTDEGFWISENNLYIKIAKTRTATLNAFKTWLSSNNIKVVYSSDVETKESIKPIVISTLVGDNELTINTEVTPTSIDITSFGDYYNKSEVDRMIADLKADIAAIAELL